MTIHTATWKDVRTLVSVTESRLSLTMETDPAPIVINFDLAGRLWSIMQAGTFYQRGLNGRVVAKWIDPETGRGRRWLSDHEVDDLEKQAYDSAAEVWDALRSNQIQFEPPLETPGEEILRRVVDFSTTGLDRDVQNFHRIFKPVGILPPDQYQAVLLQATEGCSYNQCTFCDFYRDRKFHIKDEKEFEAHCRHVREYLAQGLSLRRTIFLGDANALVIPRQRLESLFDIIHSFFDVGALGGVFAFLDAFSGEKKDVEDYRSLRARGLERVYIGLESGYDPLLNFLQKPGTSKHALQTVNALKSAGVAVGVIILLGAGGRTYADGHVRETVQLLNRMPLDMQDQIYFSQLIESEDMRYSIRAFQEDLHPLSDRDCMHQAEQIEAGLSFDPAGGTPHISRYDIREFVY